MISRRFLNPPRAGSGLAARRRKTSADAGDLVRDAFCAIDCRCSADPELEAWYADSPHAVRVFWAVKKRSNWQIALSISLLAITSGSGSRFAPAASLIHSMKSMSFRGELWWRRWVIFEHSPWLRIGAWIGVRLRS